MAANKQPIFARQWDVQMAGAVLGTTANTATDGTGAGMFLIMTADATEGSYLHKILFKPISTIAATVIRIWYCSATGAFTAGTTNTAANTTLIGEISVAAWTASNTAAGPIYELPLGYGIPASTKLLVSFGTSTGAATTGFNPSTFSGKY
jgi:hypothetical protein